MTRCSRRLGSSRRPRFSVARLDEIEAVAIPGALRWRPVRGVLGVRAFGIASFQAAHAGDELIEPHTETTDGRGHEELYFVVSGRARFELDGKSFDAPAGTLVRVDPEAHRHAVAAEPDTEILAFGDEPTFRPSGSEFIWRVRALLPENTREAQALVDEGPRGSPGVLYAQALIDHATRTTSDALADAIALEPRLRAEAEADGLT
jgi:hypothetical protein